MSLGTVTEPSLNTLRERAPRSLPPKKGKALNVVLISLMVGLLAIAAVRTVLQPKAQAVATITVVAAAEDLPPGVRLGFRNLHYLTIPKTYYDERMAATYPQLVGRTTNTFIPMGEPILATELLPQTKNVSGILSPSQRAFTLRLPAENMVDNAVFPGDRVDIVATTVAPNGKRYTKTIEQDLYVIMAPAKAMKFAKMQGSNELDKLTVIVTPAQAEVLTQAVENSKIHVTLRSPGNRAALALAGADERDLLPHEALRVTPPQGTVSEISDPPPALPQASVPPPAVNEALPLPAPLSWVVEVFQGDKKEAHEFVQK